MIELLLMAAVSMAECSFEVVGKAEAYFVAHYEHEAPSTVPSDYYDVAMWHGQPSYQCKHCSVSSLNENEIDKHVTRHMRKTTPNFSYRSPRYHVEDQVVEATVEWYPVAYQWITKGKNDREYTAAKTCGEPPHPCLCSPWDGLVADPEACTFDAPKKTEVYLIGYYLHADPEIPGIRYTYESKPIRYKKDETISIDWEGEPVGIEWFIKPDGLDEYEPILTCGEVPVN